MGKNDTDYSFLDDICEDNGFDHTLPHSELTFGTMSQLRIPEPTNEAVMMPHLFHLKLIKSEIIQISKHFEIKNENLRQSILRKFKKIMKTVWIKVRELKTKKRTYAASFRNFEKNFKGISRNDVKFAFDRIIDVMSSHSLPPNLFEQPNAIGDESFLSCSLDYVNKFFACPGVKDLFAWYHSLARRCSLYFQIPQFPKDRGVSQSDRLKMARYCVLFSSISETE